MSGFPGISRRTLTRFETVRWLLDFYYARIIRSFKGQSPDRVHMFVTGVVCTILQSSGAIRSLCETPVPFAYLRRCVRNAIRNDRRTRELLREVPLDLEDPNPIDRRRWAPSADPWRIASEREIPPSFKSLGRRKKAALVLWMQGYTDRETELTIGMSRDMARYHVSTAIAALAKRMRSAG